MNPCFLIKYPQNPSPSIKHRLLWYILASCASLFFALPPDFSPQSKLRSDSWTLACNDGRGGAEGWRVESGGRVEAEVTSLLSTFLWQQRKKKSISWEFFKGCWWIRGIASTLNSLQVSPFLLWGVRLLLNLHIKALCGCEFKGYNPATLWILLWALFSWQS